MHLHLLFWWIRWSIFTNTDQLTFLHFFLLIAGTPMRSTEPALRYFSSNLYRLSITHTAPPPPRVSRRKETAEKMNFCDLANEVLHQVVNYVINDTPSIPVQVLLPNFPQFNYSPQSQVCAFPRTDLGLICIRSLGPETCYACVSFQDTFRKYHFHNCTMTST